MRLGTTTWTFLVVTACANGSEQPLASDELAHVIGAHVVTSGGGGARTALADVTMIAHGAMMPTMTYDAGMWTTKHDGVQYFYAVRCTDRDGKRAACNEYAANAEATAVWGGLLHSARFEASMFQEAMWQIRGLDTNQAWITGKGWSAYDAAWGIARDTTSYWINLDTTSAWIFDPFTLELQAGTETGVAAATQLRTGENGTTYDLDVTMTVDRADAMRLDLGDQAYRIDLQTAEVTIETTVE